MSVSYLDLSADPLRCIQHPRRDPAQFTGLVLFPTVLLRMLFYGFSRRLNTHNSRRFYGIANIWQSISYAVWTVEKIRQLLNHPKVTDCIYNNHSILEINYILLIFFGLFPTVIIFCFVIYCISVMPVACYKICTSDHVEPQKNSVSRVLLGLLTRIRYNDRIFKDQRSCMMCDKKFENDSIVTPLPCEMRHYFHADCTELWM